MKNKKRNYLIAGITACCLLTLTPSTLYAQNHMVVTEKQSKKANIPLKKIKLNQTSIVMEVNSYTQLKVSYVPRNTTVKKKVTWTSSKPKVVKVKKDGTLQGISKGKATVTAAVAGKKATCVVTVKAATVDTREDGYVAPDSSLVGKKIKEQIQKDIDQKEVAAWTTEKSELDERYIVPIYSVKTSDLKSGTIAKKLKFTKEYAVFVNNFDEDNPSTVCKIRQTNGAWHIYGTATDGDDWAAAINSLPEGKTYYVVVKGNNFHDFFFTQKGTKEFCYAGERKSGEMPYGKKQTVKAYWKDLKNLK